MKHLQEANGKDSSTRLIFVIGSFWNMGMTTFLAINNTDPTICLAFFSGVQAVLVGLKLGQKQQENKS